MNPNGGAPSGETPGLSSADLAKPSPEAQAQAAESIRKGQEQALRAQAESEGLIEKMQKGGSLNDETPPQVIKGKEADAIKGLAGEPDRPIEDVVPPVSEEGVTTAVEPGNEEEPPPGGTGPTKGDGEHPGNPTVPPPTEERAEVQTNAEQRNAYARSRIESDQKIKDLLGKEYDPNTFDIDQKIEELQGGQLDQHDVRLLRRLEEVRVIADAKEAEKELAQLDTNNDRTAVGQEKRNEAQGKIAVGKEAERSIYARDEVLLKDPEFVEFLQQREIDPESLDVNKEIKQLKDRYENSSVEMTPEDRKFSYRLNEARGLASRHEIQMQLDTIQDDNLAAYQEARRQYETTDWAEKSHYAREALRKDKGLQKLMKNKGYSLEDADINTVLRTVGEKEGQNSALYGRLQALNGTAEEAVFADGADYDKTPEEVVARAKKMAEARKHERGFWKKGLDKLSDKLLGFQGENIRDAFNQARGYKQEVRSFNEQLKKLAKEKQVLLSDKDTKPETIENVNARIEGLEASLKNAKDLERKSWWEGVSKRSIKGGAIVWFVLFLALYLGPAILPAKLMEMAGKGAGR